jgi:NCAIR mutase (PurE)-related protein
LDYTPKTMDPERLRLLLEGVARGETDVGAALMQLQQLPYADLGYARVDHHRELRQGHPEVILGSGKSVPQLVGIIGRLIEAQQNVLVTRVDEDKAERVRQELPSLRYDATSRTLTLEVRPIEQQPGAPVAIVTAGTSDLPVAEEAAVTLHMFGLPCDRVFDVGVAGIHRLFGELGRLAQAPAVIVVAGMEGALPSVVGGLLGSPVVAVPTSVGYGASLGGFAALCGMLSSCAAGITVVNIDNGFGAAMAVARIISSRRRLGGS